MSEKLAASRILDDRRFGDIPEPAHHVFHLLLCTLHVGIRAFVSEFVRSREYVVSMTAGLSGRGVRVTVGSSARMNWSTRAWLSPRTMRSTL